MQHPFLHLYVHYSTSEAKNQAIKRKKELFPIGENKKVCIIEKVNYLAEKYGEGECCTHETYEYQ